MPFEWTIALRYLRARRSRMVSLITLISIIGVAMGVMLLIVVLSVMGGFASDLREKIVATKAHVLIDMQRGNLADPDAVLAIVEAQPDVTGASAYVESQVMISTASSVDGVVLRGIDLETIGNTSALPESIVDGQLDWLGDTTAALSELRGGRRPRGLLGEIPDPFGEPRIPLGRSGRSALGAEPAADESDPLDGRQDGSEADEEQQDESVMPLLPGQRRPSAERREHGVGSMPPIGPGGTRALPGIAIGTELANRMHVSVGSEVTIISPDGQLLPTGPAPLSRPAIVVATFYTGMYEFDTRFAYVLMDEARDLLRIPDGQVTAVDIKVSDLDAARTVATEIGSALSNAGLTGPRVRSWEETNKSLFAALKLEKIAIFVILTIIILVASFSIVSNLIVMVVERASEIAVLKSMGATNRSIVRVFSIQGGLIGVIGTAIGVVLGVGVCLFIANGGIPLDTEVYYIEYLPVDLRPVEVLLTAIAGMVISLLATVYPAYKGARLHPAEALRYD